MNRFRRVAILALPASLLCVSLTAQTPAHTPDSCSQSANATQADLNQCAGKELQEVEARLATLLKRLGIDRDRPEEKAWEAYRDAQLKAIYPPVSDERGEYGSVYPMCWAELKKKLTESRIRDLKALTTSEGDACQGYHAGGSAE